MDLFLEEEIRVTSRRYAWGGNGWEDRSLPNGLCLYSFLYLNTDGSLESLSLLLLLGGGLVTDLAATPLSTGVLELLDEVGVDGGDEVREVGLVLGTDVGQGDDGGGLLVDQGSETGLALDDGVWDLHLSAESWDEDDELDWVDVVGNEDELWLSVLDEGDDVVQAVLDNVWLLGHVLLLLALGDGGGLLGETLLLLGGGLRSVLVEQLEGLGGGVLVQRVLELGDGRWDLEPALQDLLLSLQEHVVGPLDESSHVALWLDVLADAEASWSSLEERVLQQSVSLQAERATVHGTYLWGLGAGGRLAGRWSGGGLLSFGGLCH